MLAKSVVAPIDRIKILYQVTSTHFRLRDVPSVAVSIIEKEGLEALWKGNMATMIRVFPYSGIQFMVFDYCKGHFLGDEQDSDRRRRSSRKTSVGSGRMRQQQHHDDNHVKSGSSSTSSSSVSMASSMSTDTSSTTTLGHRGNIVGEATVPRNTKNDDDKQQQQQQQQQQQRRVVEFGKGAGLTPIESLISGMIAGTTSVLFTYPLDLARAQLAVLRKKKKVPVLIMPGYDTNTIATRTATAARHSTSLSSRHGVRYVLSSTIQQNGMWGLYRGITPTLLGILPYSGIAFTINEQAKRQITNMTHREPTTIERLQCGALSGLFAQTLAYPLEVTRRRMQTIGIVPTSGSESAAVNFAVVGPSATADATTAKNTGSAAAVMDMELQQPAQQQTRAKQKAPPPSMIATMQHLFEEQGIRGFYKGVSMNWVKGPVAFSISFTAFDTIQGWIEPENVVVDDDDEEDFARRRHKEEEEEEREKRKGELSAKMNITRRLTNNDE